MMRPTEKQIQARMRNHEIRVLRGIYANLHNRMHMHDRMHEALDIIDQVIEKMGAERCDDRQHRIDQFWKVDPNNLPEGMTRREYDELGKDLFKPFGGKRAHNNRQG